MLIRWKSCEWEILWKLWTVVKLIETTGRAKDEKPLSFAAFYKQNDAVSKKKKNDRRKKDVVLIHASLLLAVKGALIQEHGSTLPVTVNVSWDHIDPKREFLTNLSNTRQQ